MKQGKPLITFTMILFTAALMCYMGYYTWSTFQTPFTSTFVYSYTLNDSLETNGLIIREEQVLPSSPGILDVVRDEGEKVGMGQVVGRVYRDDQAQRSQEEQSELRMEIAQLQLAIRQGVDVSNAAKVDEDIIQALVDLRSSCARQDYSSLEEQVLAMKSSVIKREYVYNTGTAAGDLNVHLEELKNQYSLLKAQSYDAITQITAPAAGTFSTLVDGYETQVGPEQLTQLTPSSLKALMDKGPVEDIGATGKLITSNRWYLAAVVTQEEGKRLQDAGRVDLRFVGDFVEDIPMRVHHLSPPEQGQVVVVLEANRYLEQTTLLRNQAVELIFDSKSGLRVPKAAVRMVTTTETDEETGEEKEIHTLGVYAITGGKAEFKAIRVLDEGHDFYVVESVAQDRKALRAGDEIVVRATDLYHGELLRS